MYLTELKDPAAMRHVLVYLKYHSEHSDDDEHVREEWDKQFVEVDDDMLFSLILLANMLDIKTLLDLTCKKVADEIKMCKTPQEIRRRSNITILSPASIASI